MRHSDQMNSVQSAQRKEAEVIGAGDQQQHSKRGAYLNPCLLEPGVRVHERFEQRRRRCNNIINFGCADCLQRHHPFAVSRTNEKSNRVRAHVCHVCVCEPRFNRTWTQKNEKQVGRTWTSIAFARARHAGFLGRAVRLMCLLHSKERSRYLALKHPQSRLHPQLVASYAEAETTESLCIPNSGEVHRVLLM